MRKMLFAAAICFAQPALAFDRMLLGDCQASFERLADMVEPDNANTPRQLRSITATFDGWCKITGRDPGFEDVEFDTLIWRADETSRWVNDGIPPLGLQVRITGLSPDTMQNSAKTGRPPVSIEATIRQDPNAGQVIVEHAIMANDAGDSITASAVYERVFLSSPSMMQVSIGSAVFRRGLVSMTLDGRHENPFGFNVDANINGDQKAGQAETFRIISALPDGVLNDASRAELTAFASDLPRPVGTLEVVVGSERGLGMVQLGGAMFNGASSLFDEGEDAGPSMEILFDGLAISADWTPRDGRTD